jgi:tetratricopeptide (TPR) repeat protein
MTRSARMLCRLFAVVACVAPLTAIYLPMESLRVPVERLVENLERDLKADPTNVQKVINLARLHSMAFALKERNLPATELKKGNATVVRQGEVIREHNEVPWYGYESKHVPDRVATAASPEQEKDAQAHLKESIRYYESALAMDATNLTAGIGYAWVLQQSGKKPEAIAKYRQVIAQAWKTEEKAKTATLGQRFYTEEAAGYLIPLLDPVKDASEIADLEARRKKLRAMPRPITPIAIPLNASAAGDSQASGILDPLASVAFDADGSGLRQRWTWITPDAAWLVYDARDERTITSALQWFGNVTFWLFWNNGYEALAALDDNGDRRLTGGELDHLALWHDGNRNGISEAGEVQPLASHGIVALSCDYAAGDGARVAAWSRGGATFADGRIAPTFDVILRQASAMLTRR